jgi:hypothetical protein
MNKTNSFYNHARYQITCTMMHILSVKPCDTRRYVCPFYRTAHHMKWLQLLTPTLNITNCHIYMSTAVPADAQCYVTQWYHNTPEGCPEQKGCITAEYFKSYPLHLGKCKRNDFISQDYEAADLCVTRNKYFWYCCWYWYY